jgi:hypothetical protein
MPRYYYYYYYYFIMLLLCYVVATIFIFQFCWSGGALLARPEHLPLMGTALHENKFDDWKSININC